MKKGKQMIEFEISSRCSSALTEIIDERNWEGKKSFTLPIKKGPIFSVIEKLVPSCICLFHVGCTSDSRPPNFEYWERVGDSHKNGIVDFYYRRWLDLSVFWESNWFRDGKGMRSLEDVASAFSDLRKYAEMVGLSWSGPYRGGGRSAKIILSFKSNQLEMMEGLDESNGEIFRAKMKGFEEGLFDLRDGPLKNEKLENQGVEKLFTNRGISIEDLIKDLYQLFQLSTVGFETKKS
jgi:hypothetical protein